MRISETAKETYFQAVEHISTRMIIRVEANKKSPNLCVHHLYHEASKPAIGPFWVSRMPISFVPVSILNRVAIW